MRTQFDQTAFLQKYQCCYAELAGKIATKLGKYKLCNLKNDLRDLKLSRTYLNRISKYYTIPYNYKSATLVTIARSGDGAVVITITINSVPYVYSGTGELADIMTSFYNTFTLAGWNVHTLSDDSFIVSIYDTDYDSPTVTCTNSIDDETNYVTCEAITSTEVDSDLDDENSLSREEICGIINQTICLLDPYCTTC